MSVNVIESQIADIELLQAVYPGENELIIDSDTSANIGALRDWVRDAGPKPSDIPRSLSCVLQIHLDIEPPNQPIIQLNVVFILFQQDPEEDCQPKPPKVQLRQPTWMTKADVANLFARMPEDLDTVLPILEFVRDEATTFYNTKLQREVEVHIKAEDHRTVRVWFYFPSLSTREKRDDLVIHAPEFGLTGFVLAGKPGILCLEGDPDRIDEYMRFIKTESWGDIPSHHKKVSERYRQEDVGRVFADMSEITDILGEKRGERGNRSDMKLLEAWLIERNLGQAFAHVLM